MIDSDWRREIRGPGAPERGPAPRTGASPFVNGLARTAEAGPRDGVHGRRRSVDGPDQSSRLTPSMDKIRNALVLMEVVVAILLMAGVLLQTPKATGLGGTIGGGDGGVGGGYRTRRGLERQLYYTTWVLAGVFFITSVANIWFQTHK